MLANSLESFLMSIVLYRSLQASEHFHLESQGLIGDGQVINGAFYVNFASFVLAFVEDASDVRMETGLAGRSTGALPSQSGTKYVYVLIRRLTLHFRLLHDSQAIDTRALDCVAGPAAEVELTDAGRMWRELLRSVIRNEMCSLAWVCQSNS